MIKQGKYIVTSDAYGNEAIIVFPEFMKHSDMTNGFNVISAGQIQINKDYISCYGCSITLGVDSRKNIDTELFKREFGWDD